MAGSSLRADGKPSFLARPMSRKAALITSGSALVAGLLLGGGAGGAGAQSEVTSLKDQVASLETDVADAETVAVENDTALTDARADLDEALDDLATATAALETATAQVTEMQTAATASQTELDARAARISDLEGQLSARTVQAPAAQAPAAQAPAAPAFTYYDNCTAARNAGAAPVRTGDPGYGRHLDRDGDGIGCE
ncbi:excalibur calcium-binding domain-containing protein [Microbacterium plantarum]|uniref:excalibur calcium-binding domain-containing protein n=1 Tax=Microbacterium plantarum TaxID=1816425 RepID=UPI002B47B8DC|nr:excalibur calcium-binding domain-containing protein [Microbacterium plantarum]WRK16936.1 excalibur calcium-binding domain-containing protein [Microbacterium plantarum]